MSKSLNIYQHAYPKSIERRKPLSSFLAWNRLSTWKSDERHEFTNIIITQQFILKGTCAVIAPREPNTTLQLLGGGGGREDLENLFSKRSKFAVDLRGLKRTRYYLFTCSSWSSWQWAVGEIHAWIAASPKLCPNSRMNLQGRWHEGQAPWQCEAYNKALYKALAGVSGSLPKAKSAKRIQWGRPHRAQGKAPNRRSTAWPRDKAGG